MTALAVTFDLKSFWHAGTGRGAGPELDAVVFRSAAGLPMLPGRTVRGLLREGLQMAQNVGAIDQAAWAGPGDPVVWCFGSSPDGGTAEERVAKLEEQRFTTEAGHLRLESAVLGPDDDAARDWEAWARSSEGQALTAHLFRPFASTAISGGVAKEGTLRAIELAVPMRLTSRVSGPDDRPWKECVRLAVGFVRGLGSHRNRGLGRVRVTVEELTR